jgi:hypothetical protein
MSRITRRARIGLATLSVAFLALSAGIGSAAAFSASAQATVSPATKICFACVP